MTTVTQTYRCPILTHQRPALYHRWTVTRDCVPASGV